MPQDSKRKRQLRRLKRDRTVALKLLDFVTRERNVYRQIVIDARQQAVDEVIAKSKEAVNGETIGYVAPENGGSFDHMG